MVTVKKAGSWLGIKEKSVNMVAKVTEKKRDKSKES